MVTARIAPRFFSSITLACCSLQAFFLISDAAAGALYGYCGTRIQGQRTCTDIVEIDPRDHLLERCAPWARWVEGQGYTYRNSRDRDSLREEHESECKKVIPLDSGTPHDCQAVIHCKASEPPTEVRDLGVRMRAFDREESLRRCARAAAPAYLELLVELGARTQPGSAPDCTLSMEAAPSPRRE